MIYLEKTELTDAYDEAVKTAKDWQKPFNEYERLAGNKISKNLEKNMPRVNDGSLAGSLIETPMEVLPSMQTGKFVSSINKKPWLNEIANIVWKTKIVPNANTQSAFFNKEQISLYRALKYGVSFRYNFFVSTETYTGSDWSIPYIKNVKLEPGKFSVDDCAYVFLDIYFTKLQLKNIIAQEKQAAKDAKAAGEEYKPTWDIKKLQTLVDKALTSKEQEEQNINERDKQINASGIKLTACFQRGIEAPFYMISRDLPEDDKCVREWTNHDPTGDLPITAQYCFETLESPYGLGRVELAGPTQNVLDFLTQSHVLATQIGLRPPKKVSGPIDQTNLNSLVHTPDAIWQVGNANVEVIQTATQVYAQFATNFGLYKAQLQNLQGRTDGSVSAESGDPGFSKTQAGVKMQEGRTNAQDNYLRNKADSASAKMATKMMNVYMANMSGADILDVAEEDLQRLEKAGYFDDNPQTEAPSLGELPILYDDLKDIFEFEFDARPEADDADKDRWLELITAYVSNPMMAPAMQADGYKFSVGEAFRKVILSSGANPEDVDKVLVKLNPEEMQAGAVGPDGMPIDPTTGQPVDPMADPNAAQPGMEAGPMDAQGEAPAEIAQDPQQPQEEDPAVVQQVMAKYGVSEPTARGIIAADRAGFSEEEVLNFLQGGVS